MTPPAMITTATASARMVLPLVLGIGLGVVGVMRGQIGLITVAAGLMGVNGYGLATGRDDDDAQS